MATDLNMWQGIGRLGKDVEIRFTATGDAVANFSLACGWKSKEKEGTEWVNITVFGKLAEICGKYLKKGSQVYIAGSLKTEKYTDKNGVEKYSTKVMAEKMQMLGSKQEDGEQPPNNAKLLATAKQEPSYADLDDTPF